MRFRKIALSLFACLALGAFAANLAQAAEGDGWTIGTTENQTTAGTLIPNGVHERVKCQNHTNKAKEAKTPLIFTSTLLGSAVEISATNVDCLEKKGSTNLATIDNTTSKGHSEGVLTFTGVKVLKPANCSVAGEELTTAALTDKVKMDKKVAGSTTVFDEFFPENATTGFITIEFQGSLCALAEDTGTVKGTACGESVHTNAAGTGFEPNKTGTLTTTQSLAFGSAQQTTGECALTFNGATAQLTGAVDNELESDKPFGSD
jgi:hypothetical protein